MIAQNEFSIVNLEPKQAITIREHCTASELQEKFEGIFTELNSILKKQNLSYAGTPFSIYHGYSEEDVDFEPGIPVTGSPKPEGKVKVIQTYGGKAVLKKYYGSYTNLHDAWNSLREYVQKNNMYSAGLPFEIYVTDPYNEADSSKWLTEIYYPIK